MDQMLEEQMMSNFGVGRFGKTGRRRRRAPGEDGAAEGGGEGGEAEFEADNELAPFEKAILGFFLGGAGVFFMLALGLKPAAKALFVAVAAGAISYVACCGPAPDYDDAEEREERKDRRAERKERRKRREAKQVEK